MDEHAVRERLAEAKAELAKIEDEREAWLNLVKGYEGILRVRGNGNVQLALGHLEGRPPLKEKLRTAASAVATAAVESMSFRAAVRQVLRDARGQPLHVREILRRARELGADTTAKDPVGITDLMAYSLAKSGEIEKTGPRTWRWAGTEEQAS